MINPSIRASIISGLLYPFEYINQAVTQDQTPPSPHQNPELWELPDTSILFRRYLDSGKMINVYDWFESFAVVLESQRRNARRQELQAQLEAAKSKGKGKARESPRKRGKQKQVENEEEEDEEEDEEAQEKWKLEVQARFIRALHELDYLGFIKHTGRKKDHVLRTVFDVVD